MILSCTQARVDSYTCVVKKHVSYYMYPFLWFRREDIYMSRDILGRKEDYGPKISIETSTI